ncbi:acyl-CoA thioesterase [Methylobacterium sp. WL30]|jgi:acyl-CoA thioester hydrolase|nr:acyl-CoA thioesterase [Methylobacterium sp. WL116]TXN25598.1 acyl-CoA thioesterase [Methylobacterium sp. WL93]TXN51488.1 acyl-CoA thioesterase [Methylobacterium sp. WL119]TXN66914.1 acyl-CoA thioesterase [Methylobacterium sp. WL30]
MDAAMRETPAPNAATPLRAATNRASYPRHVPIGTRWADNDVYGHVNNVVYYAFFDTAVNGLLVEAGVLDIARSPVIGLVVETGCRYHAPIAFPDVVTAGVRVARIGRSSVRYEIGLFRGDADEAAAEGFFVHVYVDRATRRPVALPEPLRTVLQGWTSAAEPSLP